MVVINLSSIKQTKHHTNKTQSRSTLSYLPPISNKHPLFSSDKSLLQRMHTPRLCSYPSSGKIQLFLSLLARPSSSSGNAHPPFRQFNPHTERVNSTIHCLVFIELVVQFERDYSDYFKLVLHFSMDNIRIFTNPGFFASALQMLLKFTSIRALR